MSKRVRVHFDVSLERPPNVTNAMLRAYVKDAVGSWCGSFMPPGVDEEAPDGDPLWNIGTTVKVSHLAISYQEHT